MTDRQMDTLQQLTLKYKPNASNSTQYRYIFHTQSTKKNY